MSEAVSSFLLRRRDVLLGSAAGVMLSGCGGADLGGIIGLPPPLRIYMLRPTLTGGQAGPSVPWQLAISAPLAPASLDTVRIALTPTPSTMDYFSDASWPDRAPALVQGLLLEAFANTGRVAAARDTEGVAADYILRTALRDFQAVYSGGAPPVPGQPSPPPQVKVAIDARLVATSDRRIVGSLSVIETADAVANDLDAIIAAFNDALENTLIQIVDWCLRTPVITPVSAQTAGTPS
ncbi:MAG: membrane integrity-associated transporter subunit PqiC [Planctomycetes bacterium]|nr:membrane integrity-associated transporter subunit PqiC [Planctomycetota bacterium]